MRRKHNLVPKLHIKKDDTVMVLSGNYKGKTGRVLAVRPKEQRAIVEGINMVVRHTKPSAKAPEGGRISGEAAIHVSKLMIVEPSSGKPSRIARQKDENGHTVRVTKRSGETLR